jgi:hypothetical protein
MRSGELAIPLALVADATVALTRWGPGDVAAYAACLSADGTICDMRNAKVWLALVLGRIEVTLLLLTGCQRGLRTCDAATDDIVCATLHDCALVHPLADSVAKQPKPWHHSVNSASEAPFKLAQLHPREGTAPQNRPPSRHPQNLHKQTYIVTREPDRDLGFSSKAVIEVGDDKPECDEKQPRGGAQKQEQAEKHACGDGAVR